MPDTEISYTREAIIQRGHHGNPVVELDDQVPEDVMAFARSDKQRSLPAIAMDPESTARIDELLPALPTTHRLLEGDSRKVISDLPEGSIHLAITSPPYWNLKEYVDGPDQLGHVEDYKDFLDAIDVVWEGILKALVPGGRLIIVVGDVCRSRRKFGRHMVVPLHASIQERCRRLGYDNLAPIIWHKIGNAQLEAPNGSRFLGKPYEPNAVVKNDIEYILFQRKSGGYRRPSLATRVMSVIPVEMHHRCFQQIWTLSGASTRTHPAPFPPKLAERLIRMFSFVGDTVVDPFMGIGTSNAVAAKLGRNSVGIEVVPSYFDAAVSAVEAGGG